MDRSFGEKPNDSDGERKTGLKYNIIVIGHDGKPSPAGVPVDYNSNMRFRPEWDPNQKSTTVTPGVFIQSQPTGGAAMITKTITYEYGFGDSINTLSIARQKESYSIEKERPNPESFSNIPISPSGKDEITPLPTLPMHLLKSHGFVSKIQSINLHPHIEWRVATLTQDFQLTSANVAREKKQFATNTISRYHNGQITRVDISVTFPSPMQGILNSGLSDPSNSSETYYKPTGERTDTWQGPIDNNPNYGLRPLNYSKNSTGGYIFPTYAQNLTSQINQLANFIRKIIPSARVVVHPTRIINSVSQLTLTISGYNLPR